LKKFKSFEEEQRALMDVYNSIKDKDIVVENKIQNKQENISELNGIKKGDFIVFNNENIELNGEVKDFIKEKYLIRGNYSGGFKEDILITFEQILEHYPKNINFENDEKSDLSNKKIQEDLILPSLDTDINNENKSVVFFPNNMKQVDIDKSLKEFYTDAKYFVVEKNNELHIVKIKDGFEMKPFVENIIDYMLKNKIIKENISKMQVVGNNSFCILKNCPKNLNIKLKGLLKNLLK
jgi:hypothetical protein